PPPPPWRRRPTTWSTSRTPAEPELSAPAVWASSGAAIPDEAQRLGQGLDLQVALGVPPAQHLLVELADAGLGYLVDEGPALGHLPVRDPAGEELLQHGGVDRRAGLEHHRGQGTLAPLGVRDAHDGGLDDVRVGHQRVLQVNRADPLTT